MSDIERVNALSHDEIRAWLKRALEGQEPLPRLTPDESPYLGVLRVDKAVKPPVRDSFRDASLMLVREFCTEGAGDPLYIDELLALTADFKIPEAVDALAKLTERFPELPHIELDTRLAVLATLVDAPPSRDMAFWERILEQDRANYASLALSAVLAINPEQAVAMLPGLPNSEELGVVAALKLDLTWDMLPPRGRFQLVEDVQAILPRCGSQFSPPVKAWADSKHIVRIAVVSSTLRAAIDQTLGMDSSPRTLSPRLCSCLA